MHWVAAFAMSAFYFYHLPFVFSVRLNAQGLLYGVGVFRARVRKKKKKKQNAVKKHMRRFFLRILRRDLIRLAQLDVDVTVGTGDAALTAELCGLLITLLNIIRATTGAKGRARITPDFTKQTLSGEVRGIARLTAGHIMKAALKNFTRHRRMIIWKGTPFTG